MEEVTVLGAGFAGMRTALELANDGFEVTLLDLREQHEYTPGLIDILRGRVKSGRLAFDIEDFLEGTGIEFEQEVVEGVIPDRKKIVTGESDRSYRNLVVALGGEPETFGIDISEADSMYSMESAEAVENKLDEVEDAIIVGSGYVGMETAGELEARGIEVRVLDQATRPLRNSPEKASHILLDYIESRDISFMGGRTVAEVAEDGVVTEDGKKIEADMVIWAGGIKAPEVVQNSFGTDSNGIAVNAGLSSEKHADVFAAGDCADTPVLETAQNAIEQAKTVSENTRKDENQELERYSPGETPLVVSIGKTGIVVYGDLVLESRLFRYLKDAIRWKYFLGLRLSRFRARHL
ncbi:MAG: NAD(P)/FAD-dependent oxidoreductase [Candidatus Nanohaloarchaea archaeon]